MSCHVVSFLSLDFIKKEKSKSMDWDKKKIGPHATLDL